MTWSQVSKSAASTAGGVRPAAVAGQFYPAQPQRLRAQVEAYLSAADATLPDKAVTAVVAPHAGYIYSGPIAGFAFQALPPADGRTVFLLGPAHYVPVHGIAVADFDAFVTPLGEIPVARNTASRLVASGRPFYLDREAHLPEHCLEVELPFLQMTCRAPFTIVPLLFGRVDPAQAAAHLGKLLAEDSTALVVVSSDLSHYHSYDDARRLDQSLLDAIAAGDLLAAGRGEACGILPILTLMALAAQFRWQPHVLNYRSSGDTAGDRSRVVGYTAVAYTSN